MASSDSDDPGHSHVFLGRDHDANARATMWVVALTAAMMAGEIVAGLAFGSMALLADGFHMATHAGALGIAAGAYAFAKRHAADRRFTFGTGKVGDLAAFASALILGLAALGIGVESVGRLLDPRPVAFGQATLVAALGLAVNLVCAVLLSGGRGHRHDPGDPGHAHDHTPRGQDNNLRSAYLHVLADALTSVLAIAALLAGGRLGWVWLDPAVGVLGAAVIARWSLTLMRSSGAVLLDMADPELERTIRTRIETGDTKITDLHVWRIGPEAHAAIVSVAGPVAAETIRARLAPIRELAHVTVECR